MIYLSVVDLTINAYIIQELNRLNLLLIGIEMYSDSNLYCINKMEYTNKIQFLVVSEESFVILQILLLMYI